MSSAIAQPIMITTRCSAGCAHCPFSNSAMERLSLPRERVIRILREISAPLVVLSGGEPFEHSEISEILEDLRGISKPFRIATGGFVSLEKWSETIRELARCGSGFQGLSIGTDVLTARCSNPALAGIWIENLKILNSLGIPYSITITVGDELSPELIDSLRRSGCIPQFFYLRLSGNAPHLAWRGALAEVFPDVPLITDLI